jgi:hypothetical protein
MAQPAQDFQVVFHDGSVQVVPESFPGDWIKWERHFGVPFAEMGENLSVERALYLAWLCFKRAGIRVAEDFDAFSDTVQRFEPVPNGRVPKAKGPGKAQRPA